MKITSQTKNERNHNLNETRHQMEILELKNEITKIKVSEMK